MSDLIAISTACASLEEAEAISTALIASRLAAGVQIDPVSSRFHWDGDVQRVQEWRLKAWSRRSLSGPLRAKIAELHSYRVFEFVMSPVEPASGPFADWIRENVPAHPV